MNPRRRTLATESSVQEEFDGARVANDDLASRREVLGAHRPLTVLVVDTSAERTELIRRWALSKEGVRTFFAASPAAALEVAAREQPEVVILDLLFQKSRGLSTAVEIGRTSPEVQVVFVVADASVPEVQAAWDLGWHRLVAAEGLEEWMERGIHHLAQLASLKRRVAHVHGVAEHASRGNVVPAASNLPLSVAESRYRETFLRSTLAIAGCRREAARMAGVPYTTFCVMLRKLGIKE